MTSVELLALSVRSTCSASVACLLVFALRMPLRRMFGCGVAYAVWLAVPLCALATVVPMPPDAPLVMHLEPVLRPLTTATQIPAAPPSAWWPPLALMVWLGGAVATAAWQIWLQRAYLSGLGKLTFEGDVAYAQTTQTSPALVGAWRPIIVVPADFDLRYTTTELDMILAHERMHARRGDHLANLVRAALRCMWWFNPLIHVGARLMSVDQELACDAAVMRDHPHSRRAYAGAMLKTQLSASETPLACQWQSTHPLKERIMHLNRTTTSAKRMAGCALLSLVIAGVSYAAWAAQETATGPTYDIALTMNIDGSAVSPHLHTRSGEPAKVAIGEGAQKWEAKFELKAQDNGKVFVASSVTHGGKPVGEPRILIALGEPASIKFDAGTSQAMEIKMTVTELAAAQLKP